jgi:F-type H+-transporting ATPase subunit delta
MAEFATLARPYAEALFNLASQTDTTEHWDNFLALLSVSLQEPMMVALCANPRFSDDQRIALLVELCESQKITLGSLENNFLRILADNQRFAVLPEIYKQYHALQIENAGYLTVDLTCTYALKTDQKIKLIKSLEQRFNKKIQLNVDIDRNLLGGWVIRADGQMIDLSARGRLQQLASTL